MVWCAVFIFDGDFVVLVAFFGMNVLLVQAAVCSVVCFMLHAIQYSSVQTHSALFTHY